MWPALIEFGCEECHDRGGRSREMGEVERGAIPYEAQEVHCITRGHRRRLLFRKFFLDSSRQFFERYFFDPALKRLLVGCAFRRRSF